MTFAARTLGYNGSSFTPISYTYTNTTPGSGSVAVPSGATQVVVQLWGPGGGGGGGYTTAPDESLGGAGGAGAYSRITRALTGADTSKNINYTLGTRGTAGANSASTPTNGGNGSTSSATTPVALSSGTFTLSVPGGGLGTAGGASFDGTGGPGGGLPTGGDVNTTNTPAGDGGTGPSGGGVAITGLSGATGGAGGGGGKGTVTVIAPTIGGDAKVIISFT